MAREYCFTSQRHADQRLASLLHLFFDYCVRADRPGKGFERELAVCRRTTSAGCLTWPERERSITLATGPVPPSVAPPIKTSRPESRYRDSRSTCRPGRSARGHGSRRAERRVSLARPGHCHRAGPSPGTSPVTAKRSPKLTRVSPVIALSQDTGERWPLDER